MDSTTHGAATAAPIGSSIEYSPAARPVADIPAVDGRAGEQAAGGTLGWKAWAKRFASGVSWIGVQIASAIARELRIRRDTQRLMDMSDHLLKDIGLRRADIPDAVRYGRD
jgi:uncharacterized protein YjiS (DUF1127 family)